MWRAASTDVRATKPASFAADSAPPAVPARASTCTAPPRASFEAEDLETLSRLRLAGVAKIGRAQQQIAAATQQAVVPVQHSQDSVGLRYPAQHRGGSAQVDTSEHDTYEHWRTQYPCALQQLNEIRDKLRGKRLAVFLDYDGTLTPIVSNPDEAVLSPQMREVVRNVARLFPTAIISGRGREKVENFVQLRELYYAGSHGMDIAGPTEQPSCGGPYMQPMDMTFQPAAHFRPLIDSVYQDLQDRLASIPGSSVEHNTFCVSAHFRNCEPERWQDVMSAVEQVVSQNPELRMTRGRKVVEIRPKVNWHKGTALEHLLRTLHLRDCPDVVALYIGDDHTDEDAFRTLREIDAGFGVLVSTKVRDTAASYTVRDPAEVYIFLQALVQYGMSQHNGWASCSQQQQQTSGLSAPSQASGHSTASSNGSSSPPAYAAAAAATANGH